MVAFNNYTSLTNVYATDIAAWCSILFSDVRANPLFYADNLYLNDILVIDLVIDSITSIGNYAFCKRKSLTNIIIPDSVTSIGDCTFFCCVSLEYVTIGNGVTYIGELAFGGCSKLTSVIFINSNGRELCSSSAATSGISIDVSYDQRVALNLLSTYSTYYWNRT